MKQFPLLMLLLSIALTACNAPLPAQALVGAQPKSAKLIATRTIGQWSAVLPPSSHLRFILVRRAEDGALEYRVSLRTDGQEYYIGALTQQFASAPFVSAMFSIANERYIIGRVDDSLAGKLDSIGFEHPTADPSQWMSANKVSLLNSSRLFIIPIGSGETQDWNELAYIYIHTRESLQLTVQSPTSVKAWETRFTPALPIETYFVPVAYP